MLGPLSLAFRRGGPRIAADVKSLLKKGFSPADVSDLLKTAETRKLRGGDIRELQKEAARLAKECESLEKKRKSQDANHARLMEGMQSDISGLQAHLGAYQDNVARLEGEISKLGDVIAGLQARLDVMGPAESTCGILSETMGLKRSMNESRDVDSSGNALPGYTYAATAYLDQLDLSAKSVLLLGGATSVDYWSGRSGRVVQLGVSKDGDSAEPAGQSNDSVERAVVSTPTAAREALSGRAGTFDIVVLDCEDRRDYIEVAQAAVAESGMIVLDDADWHPASASLLRTPDVIQVDFESFGPQRAHLWTTSIFLKRGASFEPSRVRQPTPSKGSDYAVVDSSLQGGVEKPGLNGLDNKLAPYLNFEGGIFIEAGGNDGFAQSNTFHLENALGWKGLLIEAVPALAEQARFNRARSTIYNCALVADEVATPSVTVHYSNLMSVVADNHPTPDTIQKHVEAGLAVQNIESTYTIEVTGRTLTSVLDEYNAPRQIDFFSLDVEGYEVEVLKGLDFAKHAPKWILVETSRIEEIAPLLTSNGYTQVAQLTFHDYLFRFDGVPGQNSAAH